jgi:hypothetical protein
MDKDGTEVTTGQEQMDNHARGGAKVIDDRLTTACIVDHDVIAMPCAGKCIRFLEQLGFSIERRQRIIHYLTQLSLSIQFFINVSSVAPTFLQQWLQSITTAAIRERQQPIATAAAVQQQQRPTTSASA